MNYMIKPYRKTRWFVFALLATFGVLSASAQTPVFKVDCNQTGRQPSEVNEPGYLSWTIPTSTGNTTSLALTGGITVTLTRKGPYGDKLSTNWFKEGVQAPHYGRLSGDGIKVNNGNAGAQIEMRISGLPTGRHTILTYHNNVDNPATNKFAPLDIYQQGVKKYEDMVLTVRENVAAKVATAYFYADAIPGQDVVLLFVADTAVVANNKNFMINGFEINTPNPKYQAHLPLPQNADEHVDADNGTLILSWKNAANAVASHLYIGHDSLSVANATISSPLYKGKLTASSFLNSNQYSMSTYFWRVDQEDAEGNITHGNIWYYRPRQLAFRDAEGYGRYARGGRGGIVVTVTNLNDNGPGSLRDAVENQKGPRTIVFAVSGLIQLKSRLVLNSPYVTLAGQTAPGKGICIRSAPLGITGNDCIVRHMRVRLGSGTTYDGMGLTGANFSIVDNSSISWTIDEAFSSRGAHNITLQRTLISEALNIAGHQNYPAGTAHGYAATIGGAIGSFHHNLLAHCDGRNWSLGGGLDGSGFYSGQLDITNNVVYNWRNRTTDGGAKEVNFVNNYYKPGAASRIFHAFTLDHEGTGKGMQRCYFDGNVMPGYFDENTQTLGRRSRIRNGEIVNYETFVDAPFFPSYVATQSARDAYKRVMSNVGATQPIFDDHDIRIVRETMDSTFTYRGSKSNYPGLPDSHTDVGGWENYPQIKRAANWDTDLDGLPDWFELLKKTDTHSAAGDFSDSNADPERDGFTYLDEYLEIMGDAHYFTRPGKMVKIDLNTLTKGYSKAPEFTILNQVNGNAVQPQSQNGIVFFVPPHEGFSSFKFSVKDADGSSMTRIVNIVASNHPALAGQHVKFTGLRKDPSTVELDWSAENEIVNGSYDVQRSFSEAGPFVTIATVEIKENKSTPYKMQDINDYSGVSYYRLVQKTEKGETKQSKIAVVNGSQVSAAVKIWPVPAKGRVNIQYSSGSKPISVQVSRIDGTIVLQNEMIYPGIAKSLNLPQAGTYIIKGIQKESGQVVFSNKVVLQ